MSRARVIPVLLLDGRGLYKTVRFKRPRYVGDPVNVVRIFNDKQCDELVLLDIAATAGGHEPDYEFIREIASEAFMPVSYGGGIRSVSDALKVLGCGIEKVVLNTHAHENPELIGEVAKECGSSAVTVAIDVKRSMFGAYSVRARGGASRVDMSPVDCARRAEALGAGELIISSIDRDGTMEGYDCQLIEEISRSVLIPVVAVGGASGLDDMARAMRQGASAVAAGSMFVFQGPHRAVLISYPAPETIEKLSADQGK